MTAPPKKFVFCCNEVKASSKKGEITLNYLPQSPTQNVVASLPRFVEDILHIPARTLDLLEIAVYVFAADRLADRGPTDAVEYHAWPRHMVFRMKVRDLSFWQQGAVRSALSKAIQFMSGDARIDFDFRGGHATPPTNLFDRTDIVLQRPAMPPAISLFSGGLDSLAGALTLLEAGQRTVLVSHQSHTGTIRTQRALVKALIHKYGRFVSHYTFECHLKGSRAPEESQRTRAFLYCAIAYALAESVGSNEILVYENGVTSINLYRREDQLNARASRTTHPRTMALVGTLFSLVVGKPFRISLPFIEWSKRDVIKTIRRSSLPELISSTVSCTRAFHEATTHCGTCFQCIDRRIATYAAEAEDSDHSGLYAKDIITSSIEQGRDRTAVVDYVRQATQLATQGSGWFETEFMSELAYVTDSLPFDGSELMKVEKLWLLMRKHGENVRRGIQRMRDKHDDPFRPLPPFSLLGLASSREHLKPEARRLAESICELVTTIIPEAFRINRPVDENDLNEKLRAFLRSHNPTLRSEHPTVSFACAKVVPDHTDMASDLLIESKYLRKGTPPSKASEGIAGDITKFPPSSFLLFLVYDPDHSIISDDVYMSDLESRAKNRCIVKILR